MESQGSGWDGVCWKLSSNEVSQMVRQGAFQITAWKAPEGAKGKELGKVTPRHLGAKLGFCPASVPQPRALSMRPQMVSRNPRAVPKNQVLPSLWGPITLQLENSHATPKEYI